MAGRGRVVQGRDRPGQPARSAPHAAGTYEHLTAQTDGLRVKTARASSCWAPARRARYRADVEHEIANDGRLPARALMVVVYE